MHFCFMVLSREVDAATDEVFHDKLTYDLIRWRRRSVSS